MNKENSYLIPANSKKSMLILGFFTLRDLIIAVLGIVTTFTMFITIKSPEGIQILLVILPIALCSFLVMPIPHYHNVLQLIINIFSYLFLYQNNYKWKGWAIDYEEEQK